MLELVETIYKRTENLQEGCIKIVGDNRDLMKMIHSKMDTSNAYIQDAAVLVARIREIIKQSQITISFEWMKAHPKRILPFCENPNPYMIIKCYKIANQTRENIE